jgi:hypothetical protein
MVDKTIYTSGFFEGGAGDVTASWTTGIPDFLTTSVAAAFGTWTGSTGTFDIGSDLGTNDGIFFKWRYEFDIAVDPFRWNVISRMEQTAGADDFTTGYSGGYCHTNGNNLAWNNGWAFCHAPATNSTFRLNTLEGPNVAGSADDLVDAAIEVVPMNYSAIGMYSSTSTSLYGGTTPTVITGWATDFESDTAQIQRNVNEIQLKGDNKRYLILASTRREVGGDTGRTQRVLKLYADGTPKSMSHHMGPMDGGTEHSACCLTDIVETATATVDIDLRLYRGDGELAREGGAGSDNSVPDSADHTLVVIELKDGCEVFRSHDPTGLQECATAGPIDIDVCDTVDFNDAASWTKKDVNEMDATVTMDALLGACVAVPRNTGGIASSSRWSAEGAIIVNGTEENRSVAGTYSRGLDSTESTFGHVLNPLGVISLTAGDDVGVSVTESGSGTGGSDCETEPFGSNEGIVFWGINLDTTDNEGATVAPLIHAMKQQV